MITPNIQTYASASADPNTQRVITELASVLNDVELRLHLVRVGLSQAFPQLAQSPVSNPMAGVNQQQLLASFMNPATTPATGIGAIPGTSPSLQTINPFGLNPAVLAQLAMTRGLGFGVNTANPIEATLATLFQQGNLGVNPLVNPLGNVATGQTFGANPLAALFGIPQGIGVPSGLAGVNTPFGLREVSSAPFRW